MEKKHHFVPLIGAILAILVGILRGVGGLTLFVPENSKAEIGVGIGLIAIALWLIINGIICIIKGTPIAYKWLAAGIVLFWIDGIINGFILYGSPQLSGQIINAVILIAVLLCLSSKMKEGNSKQNEA